MGGMTKKMKGMKCNWQTEETQSFFKMKSNVPQKVLAQSSCSDRKIIFKIFSINPNLDICSKNGFVPPMCVGNAPCFSIYICAASALIIYDSNYVKY